MKAKHRSIRVGQKFGVLTVVGGPILGNKQIRFPVRCECGDRRISYASNLLNSGTGKRCIHQKTLRNRWGSGCHTSWLGMMSRCTNKSDIAYPRYGGRGIYVFHPWRNFDKFHEDMGDRPDGMTLDRIDNNGNYEPGNCRWATRLEQSYNRSTSRFVCAGGQKKCVKAWANELGLNYSKLLRLASKDADEAVRYVESTIKAGIPNATGTI